MWLCVVTEAQKEFSVRDELISLGLAVFCPYTTEKVRTKTSARPRTVFKAQWQDVARWPRYLFVKTADISAVLAVRAVRYVVRATEGQAAYITDEVMKKLRSGCDASGRVVRRAELVDFSVGDLLRFVSGSSFAGHTGEVLSIEDAGAVRVLVDGRVKATVDFQELVVA